MFEAVIITNSSKSGGVSGQSQPGKRRAVLRKLAAQFRRQVLGVGSASSIAEENQLVVITDSRRTQCH
jgi:hypothetical protein